jgi:hypothetical protein
MVYCEGVEVESKLGKLIQAFRCDRPSEWQMDEFIQLAEDMHKEITSLREAEKDAARYRLLRDESDYVDFEFFESLEKDRWNYEIDELIKEKGDE